jgi:hypothetical protein
MDSRLLDPSLSESLNTAIPDDLWSLYTDKFGREKNITNELNATHSVTCNHDEKRVEGFLGVKRLYIKA